MTMTPEERTSLLEQARLAAKQAYAPYSQFTVGAAILGSDGKVFTGFNIENASYGLTLCAERVAAARALAEGCRLWVGLAVVSPTAVAPCGSCRQFLAEFGMTLEIWIGALDPHQNVRVTHLSQLLPDAMSLDTKNDA